MDRIKCSIQGELTTKVLLQDLLFNAEVSQIPEPGFSSSSHKLRKVQDVSAGSVSF
jgi:hypothetical protein